MTAFKARIWILGRKIFRFHPFLILQSFLSLSLLIFSENERERGRCCQSKDGDHYRDGMGEKCSLKCVKISRQENIFSIKEK